MPRGEQHEAPAGEAAPLPLPALHPLQGKGDGVPGGFSLARGSTRLSQKEAQAPVLARALAPAVRQAALLQSRRGRAVLGRVQINQQGLNARGPNAAVVQAGMAATCWACSPRPCSPPFPVASCRLPQAPRSVLAGQRAPAPGVPSSLPAPGCSHGADGYLRQDLGCSMICFFLLVSAWHRSLCRALKGRGRAQLQILLIAA